MVHVSDLIQRMVYEIWGVSIKTADERKIEIEKFGYQRPVSGRAEKQASHLHRQHQWTL